MSSQPNSDSGSLRISGSDQNASYRRAIITEFRVRRERITLTDGHLRAKVELIDRSMLEFSEYFQSLPDGRMLIATYSYHWADTDGTTIKRWDNTPHHGGLPGFPHHIHIGDGDPIPGNPLSIFQVIDEIAHSLR